MFDYHKIANARQAGLRVCASLRSARCYTKYCKSDCISLYIDQSLTRSIWFDSLQVWSPKRKVTKKTNEGPTLYHGAKIIQNPWISADFWFEHPWDYCFVASGCFSCLASFAIFFGLHSPVCLVLLSSQAWASAKASLVHPGVNGIQQSQLRGTALEGLNLDILGLLSRLILTFCWGQGSLKFKLDEVH